jgi:hypothetical protein
MANRSGTMADTVKILKDWRNQNNMVSTALSGIAEMYDDCTKEDVCEMLNGISSALDDCSRNLAESIANAKG